MVFKFWEQLKAKVTPQQFKEILLVTDQDIKFNRVKFNKRTNPKQYIDICNRCANVILRIGDKI